MNSGTEAGFKMRIHEIQTQPTRHGYDHVKLVTSRGIVEGHYYPVEKARRAAIWVGGAGGGWDSPTRGLYPDLCQRLQKDGIASLRVRYRLPNQLAECALDVLAGEAFLEGNRITSTALIGHSFGGAV